MEFRKCANFNEGKTNGGAIILFPPWLGGEAVVSLPPWVGGGVCCRVIRVLTGVLSTSTKSRCVHNNSHDLPGHHTLT